MIEAMLGGISSPIRKPHSATEHNPPFATDGYPVLPKKIRASPSFVTSTAWAELSVM